MPRLLWVQDCKIDDGANGQRRIITAESERPERQPQVPGCALRTVVDDADRVGLVRLRVNLAMQGGPIIYFERKEGRISIKRPRLHLQDQLA